MQKQEHIFRPIEQRVHYGTSENNEPISSLNNAIQVIKRTQEALYLHIPIPCAFIKCLFSYEGQFQVHEISCQPLITCWKYRGIKGIPSPKTDEFIHQVGLHHYKKGQY